MKAATIGLALGMIVTVIYHGLVFRGEGRPTLRDLLAAHGWAARVGRSRWRYANLPVGGLVLAIVAAILHWGDGLAAAAGAAIAAIAMRWLDPLPRVD